VYENSEIVNDPAILNRLKMALSIGNFSGIFYLILIVVDYLILMMLVTFCKKKNITKVKDFPYEEYKKIIKTKYL